MTIVPDVTEAEIHPSNEHNRLWEIMLYGDDVHFVSYANTIEFKSGQASWSDPQSEYSKRFSYVTFEQPISVMVVNDHVIEKSLANND